ncbi:MAG: hypothetical protein MSO56_00910 [Clostridiales bacterium]|nr:hypothetical protein [Clostridiales bacterium]
MKKLLIFLLTFCLLFSLCACGKDEPAEPAPSQTVQEAANPIYEVKITMDNLYDYFEYREYTTYIKNDNGSISNVQVSYGLALKEGYTAANSPKYKDTMEITFTADGVVNSGDFDVDYTTLQYSGTVTSTERSTVTETLKFWPKGDRTVIWTFGNYSDCYILYLENFTVTSAKGSIFLKNS